MNKLSQELVLISQKNDLINLTWQLFWENYEQYLIEEPIEARKFGLNNTNSIKAYFDSISYKLMNNDAELLIVEIKMNNNNNNKYLGYYKSCFNMNGDFIDDFFVIE